MKCKKCGFENNDNIQFCENCGGSIKKKSGKFKQLIVTVLAIAIPVGIPIAVRNGIREYNKQQNDPLEHLKDVNVESINDYLNKKEYKKGVLDGNMYINEYWGVKFEAPQDWIMFNSEEIEEYLGKDTEDFYNEMVAVSATSGLEINIIGENLPIDNLSMDNYIKMIKKSIGLNMKTKEETISICGEEYTVLTGESDGVTVDVYVRINESRSFCIVIKYLNESREEVNSVVDFFSSCEESE